MATPKTAPVKRKEVIPENETKAAKFARVAKKRGKKAIKAIANLEKLAGSGYEYTPENAAKIVAQLMGAVASVESALKRTKVADADFSI